MIWLALAFFCFLSVMLFARIRVISQELKRQKAVVHKQGLELADVFQELRTLLNADLVLDKKFNRLFAQIEALDSKQESLELDVKKDSAYHQAIKMLELGENSEEVMKSCHLTKAEVDLLSNLNGYQALMQRQK